MENSVKDLLGNFNKKALLAMLKTFDETEIISAMYEANLIPGPACASAPSAVEPKKLKDENTELGYARMMSPQWIRFVDALNEQYATLASFQGWDNSRLQYLVREIQAGLTTEGRTKARVISMVRERFNIGSLRAARDMVDFVNNYK